MRKLLVVLLLSLLPSAALFSQTAGKIVWWNPQTSAFPVIEGQAWPTEVANFYDRLPARAEKRVRPPVWNLSENSAGLLIRFRSNAGRIIVRYTVGGGLNMPHMPTTGVSGLDLYAKDADGAWLWSAGRYSYRDTIVCTFPDINPRETYHDQGREYHLYLPLYNSVTWMEIGVPDGALFAPLPLRREKPIVVYGTSIAQGGCASRPGMAWPAILGRDLDRPVINLGFSGNGRLENELANLLAEINAKAYVLDCLPNLIDSVAYPAAEVIRRTIETVRILRDARPGVPILITDHDGYTDGSINLTKRQDYTAVNKANHEAFARIKSEGFEQVYLLTREEIGITLDAMVDGTHPSDLGMMQYASAYEKALRRILDEPVGTVSTTQPCTQYREPGMYDWEARHEELLRLNRENPPITVFIGNSITHYWAGEPAHPLHRGEDSWKSVMDPLGTRNFGFGWDRVENVIWRVYHDELDGFSARRVMVNIGTNNLQLNTDQEIIEGMRLLIHAVKSRQPRADILVLGLYPRRGGEERVAALNLRYAALCGELDVRYADVGQDLLKSDGKIDESLFTDGLHPNAEGYRRIAARLAKAES